MSPRNTAGARGAAARGYGPAVRYQFVDCRWSLDDPGWGRARYLEGHVPGATFLDVERDLSAPPGRSAGIRSRRRTTSRARPAPPGSGRACSSSRTARSGAASGSGGCSATSATTTARCSSPSAGAGRWRPARSRSSRSRSSRPSAPATRSGSTSSPSRHADLVVVDARVPARWRGEENPVDRVPGRIPGAVNAPWNEPLPELPPGELAAYCGSGVTSCVTLHRLHLAGREGRLYPGSWSEWEQRPELPVERG